MKTAHPVKRVSSKEELKKAFAIRLRVFVKEQGVPKNMELDADDKEAIHLLAFFNGRAVGTARIVIDGKTAKVGRMAVVKSYRSRGIGTRLLKRALGIARRKKPEEIFLNAQVQVIGFYEKLGFRGVGPVFHEAGIPHRKMTLHADKSAYQELTTRC